MRLSVTLALLACALSACTHGGRTGKTETFGAAFATMQSDPAFLASRAHPDLRVIERFAGEGDAPPLYREIPCTIAQMHAAGWHVLPGLDRLAASGATYGAPEPDDLDGMVVTMGAEAGAGDAVYGFRVLDGTWRLKQIEIQSELPPGETMPPLPC